MEFIEASHQPWEAIIPFYRQGPNLTKCSFHYPMLKIPLNTRIMPGSQSERASHPFRTGLEGERPEKGQPGIWLDKALTIRDMTDFANPSQKQKVMLGCCQA